MAKQTREVGPKIAEHVVWRDVPGELVLFDQRSGQYHTLNEIGAAIWREVSRGETMPAIVATLGGRYAAAPEVIARDVGDFVAASIHKGLLTKAQPASGAGTAGSVSTSAVPKSISDQHLIARRDELIAVDLHGQTVILDADNGLFYQLNLVGTRIWAMLDAPSTILHLCERLQDRFDVNAETCRRDVMDFIQRLGASRLIEVRSPPAPPE